MKFARKIGVTVFLMILLSLLTISVAAPNGDETEPDTNVTYFTRQNENDNPKQCVWNGTDNVVFLNYNSIVGHGISTDEDYGDSTIEKIFYKFNVLAEEEATYTGVPLIAKNWITPTTNINDGWNKLCGRAEDKNNNTETYFYPDDCCLFCIDTENPDKVQNVQLSNPSGCVSNYINEIPEFSWDEATDDGCSGVEYYEIEVYYSNGTLYYNDTTEETSITIDEPENGENYYIRVRAVDKSGNKGEWSEESEDVHYDIEDPSVTINSQTQGTWFKDDFEVNETDEDPEDNLWKCYYKIVNEGTTTLDWTEMECNENVIIDISEYCPEDGTCTVHKNATDKACNSNKAYKWYKVDTHNPNTTKTVGEPKYFGREWLGWIIDWFVTDSTSITLNCDDNGGIDDGGCDAIQYKITYPNGTVTEDLEYTSPFSLDQGDGVYIVEYWSNDSLGHEEEHHIEIDKVDTEAPVTTKEYIGPQLSGWRMIQGINIWIRYISSKTQIILTPEDEEVGVNSTWWTLFVPSTRECDDDEFCFPEAYLNGEFYEPWEEEFRNCINDTKEKEIDAVEYCNITFWEPKTEYMDEYCKTEKIEEGLFILCLYNESEPITIEQDSEHKICYFSVDNLENGWPSEEDQKNIECQVFSVDNTPPEINVLNPTEEEIEVEKCVQSIVAIVEDDKSGTKRVWVELYNESGNKVREEEMQLTVYRTYEVLMDKQLPSGEYTLKVKAEDNVGNINEEEISETLTSGVFVEYIEDPICKIDPETRGECEFTFHVCMRNSNSIKMWMSKLGQVVTPAMMNATISKEENSAYVSLLADGIDAELLELSEEEINGRTDFDLSLNIPSNVASMIGIGAHKLDYNIKSYI